MADTDSDRITTEKNTIILSMNPGLYGDQRGLVSCRRYSTDSTTFELRTGSAGAAADAAAAAAVDGGGGIGAFRPRRAGCGMKRTGHVSVI